MSEPQIASCENTSKGFCDYLVYYKHNGTVFIDQPEITKPPRNAQQHPVGAYGIHCESGSTVPGYEEKFWNCSWVKSSGHAPKTEKCGLALFEGWKLSRDSTCNTTSSWGPHSGAGPGGECVLFGLLDQGLLYTPMGIFDALSTANSGNHNCIKPLPPSAKCELRLNNTLIDHGTMPANGSSSVSITGEIDCGKNPVVEFIGGNEINMASGVKTTLNANIEPSSNLITINSHMTTFNATGGDYSTEKIITISPW
ncbi:hypothetical protein [Enterobacter bugandensis]|uniref:hypothetical protein n=1 Tax=Enterobacter bugandensis TaxID=881260 RepID=UPI0013D5B25A|nr:hypothetical protein [Enterobacter bugandensis]